MRRQKPKRTSRAKRRRAAATVILLSPISWRLGCASCRKQHPRLQPKHSEIANESRLSRLSEDKKCQA